MENAGRRAVGGPGAPSGQSPQLVGGSLSTAQASVLSPCNSGSSRKWLNPMYFYTQHTPVWPGQIITLYMYGRDRGGVRYMWGKGLNTKKVVQSQAPELETACANYRQKSSGWMSTEGQRYLKTIVLPNLGARGRAAPLWASSGAFSGHSSTRDAGDATGPFPISPEVTFLLHLLGVSPPVPWLIPSGTCFSDFLSRYTRGANPTVPYMICPRVSLSHQSDLKPILQLNPFLLCCSLQ